MTRPDSGLIQKPGLAKPAGLRRCGAAVGRTAAITLPHPVGGPSGTPRAPAPVDLVSIPGPWPVLEAGVLVLLLVGLTAGMSLLAGTVLGFLLGAGLLPGPAAGWRSLAEAPILLVAQGGMLLILVRRMAGRHGMGPDALGLSPGRSGGLVREGAVSGAGLWAMVSCASLFLVATGILVPEDLPALAASNPWLAMALRLPLSLVLAPLTEEILFRGFLYGALRRRMGPEMAAALSAGIFFLLHLGTGRGLPWSIFSLGLLLARLYETRRSLLPCVAAHAAYNGCVEAAGAVLVLARAL